MLQDLGSCAHGAVLPGRTAKLEGHYYLSYFRFLIRNYSKALCDRVQHYFPTTTDNRITSFFSVIRTSKLFFLYLSCFKTLFHESHKYEFSAAFPHLSNSYGFSPVCSLVRSVSRDSLSPLFVCVKC